MLVFVIHTKQIQINNIYVPFVNFPLSVYIGTQKTFISLLKVNNVTNHGPTQCVLITGLWT